MRLKGGDFYEWIGMAASATGLPWWLLYGVIEQESGFDPQAESSCGALGLMQLMPSSFPGVERAELLRPATNVRLGSEHLRECVALWREESRDQALQFGLASYNGGPGYVLAAQHLAMEDGSDPHSWASVALRLAVCTCNGKHPDAAQMTGYVEAVWSRFERRRQLPVPAETGQKREQVSDDLALG